MPALWIFPFNVLVRTADPAAAAFMTALVAYLHPSPFPLIHLCWAKYCTNFIGTLCHAHIMIQYGQMRFCITFKTEEILFFLDILR